MYITNDTAHNIAVGVFFGLYANLSLIWTGIRTAVNLKENI